MAILGMGQELRENHAEIDGRERHIACHFRPDRHTHFAGDLADAIGWILDRRMTDKKGIYHFSNEGVCSWYDFAAVIARLAGNECDVRPIHTFEYPSKVKRPHYSVLDKTKFRETFGYKIPHWMESLENVSTR